MNEVARTDLDLLQLAREIITAESDAVRAVADHLDTHFERAVEMMLRCKGMVVVGGVGKSGLIGQKISATLSSVGIPSHFLHPTEAMHGDLGRIRKDDMLLLLSHGGQTEEVLALAALVRQDNVPVISITGKRESHLAKLSQAHLCIGDVTEACPHNLAPTASTTAMLAMGDALALVISSAKAFSVEDYRKRHPGGLLGKQTMLLTDVMRFRVGENLPLVSDKLSVEAVLHEAGKVPRRTGAVLLVNEAQQLTGIFTDSDLRRMLVEQGAAGLQQPVANVMTQQPQCLTDLNRVRDAVQLIREVRIDEIPIVNSQQQPVGLIDVQDMIALKVIEDE